MGESGLDGGRAGKVDKISRESEGHGSVHVKLTLTSALPIIRHTSRNTNA